MKPIIDEIPLEKKNNILVRLQLEENDPTFIATRYGISFIIDEDLADKLAFHLMAILEDRQRKKDLTKLGK